MYFSRFDKKKTLIIFFLSLFLFIGIYLLFSLIPSVQQATIQRVVDGDTIIVNYNDKDHKIRFLGINAPESVNPNQLANSQKGVESSNYLKSLLKPGDTVYLEQDPHQQNKDKYDRLLRYVWTEYPSSNFETFVNYQIVKNGYAEINFYGHETAKYKGVLEQAAQIYMDENQDIEYIDHQI